MKNYKVVNISSYRSKKLREKVEHALNDLSASGWNIIDIEFTFNQWYIPTAYITFNK